jgi:hypothetical protein
MNKTFDLKSPGAKKTLRYLLFVTRRLFFSQCYQGLTGCKKNN